MKVISLDCGPNFWDHYKLYNPWCEKFGYQADDVLNILVKCGYKCFYASQKALIKINNITNENDVYNYFFLHENKHNAIISKLS